MHCTAADNPAHHRITGETLCIIDIRVSGQPSKMDWRRRPVSV